MRAFGKSLAAFFLMVVIGYVAMIVFLPAPDTAGWQPNDRMGPSAATRLSQEARGLVGRKTATSLQ